MRTAVMTTATAPMQRLRNLVRRAAWRVLGKPPLTDLQHELASSRSEVQAVRDEVARLHEGLRSLRNEIAGQFSFLAHDLGASIHRLQEAIDTARADDAGRGSSSNAALVQALRETVMTGETAIQSRLNEIHSQGYEGLNRIIHLDTSVHTRINELLHAQMPTLLEQIHQAAALGIDPQGTFVATDASTAAAPQPLAGASFEQAIERAQQDFPTVYAAWKQRLDEISAAFAATKEGNAAHGADVYSQLFKAFVDRHAQGPVLDVGCGPFGKPYYLADCPDRSFAGLEPLPCVTDASLNVVRGISEYLPWNDGSFATVISATSLDHCLALDRSLDEVVRVLQSDGKFLLWIGSVPGSPPYRPLDPAFEPADRFHLFHFDVDWFEPMLAQRFDIVDRVKLERAGYAHVFYCLRPLAGGPTASGRA